MHSKIFINLGELVAGGHIVNNRPLGPVGKPSAKQAQRDKNLLEGLGIVTCKPPPLSIRKTKVDKLLADTPGIRAIVTQLVLILKSLNSLLCFYKFKPLMNIIVILLNIKQLLLF